MELMSLYYFMEAAKDLHITETAVRLYMSQQTLSNHILRVEEYYGTRLFNRRPRLQLTSTGREVLAFARLVFAEEKNLKNRLTDAMENEAGEILMGASSPRSNTYLPQVLLEFSTKYPNVNVKLVDKTSAVLEQKVIRNELDFAVCVGTEVNSPNLVKKSVHVDPIYFCVSDRLLRQYYGEETKKIKEKSLEGAHMEDFKKLPFLTIDTNNRLGKKINLCFQEAGYVPRSYLETSYTTMMVPLCNGALAACFTSHMNLTSWKEQLEEDVNIFPLYGQKGAVSLTVSLITHKQRYLDYHSRYLLSLLEAHFSSLERQRLARLA